jgi:hypothetical protein
LILPPHQSIPIESVVLAKNLVSEFADGNLSKAVVPLAYPSPKYEKTSAGFVPGDWKSISGRWPGRPKR